MSNLSLSGGNAEMVLGLVKKHEFGRQGTYHSDDEDGGDYGYDGGAASYADWDGEEDDEVDFGAMGYESDE